MSVAVSHSKSQDTHKTVKSDKTLVFLLCLLGNYFQAIKFETNNTTAVTTFQEI